MLAASIKHVSFPCDVSPCQHASNFSRIFVTLLLSPSSSHVNVLWISSASELTMCSSVTAWISSSLELRPLASEKSSKHCFYFLLASETLLLSKSSGSGGVSLSILTPCDRLYTRTLFNNHATCCMCACVYSNMLQTIATESSKVCC